MINKNFEDKLKSVCKKDINIPQKFTYAIKSGLYKNNKKWRVIEMKKAIVSILCIAFVGTGIVFASNSLGNFWKDNGVKTALEYGYIQNIEMDYDVQSDIGIKLDSIIMDDSNIGIVFNYKIPSNLQNINNIVLTDIVIKDENNNIIFEDGNPKCLSTGYSTECAIENGIVKQAILLKNLNHTFPKSNNIYMSFSTVKIYIYGKNIKTISGNWNFDVNVTDKFINREPIKYIASQSKDIEVISAELSSTGLDIEMKFYSPLNVEYLGRNIKIQDNNGNEYFSDEFNAKDERTIPIVKTSFPITKYDSQDNLKLIIKTDKEIIIELNKVK